MKGLRQRYESPHQQLGTRAANHDGTRIEHVLDDAHGITQPIGRLTAPHVQSRVLIAFETSNDLRTSIRRLRDTESLCQRMQRQIALQTPRIPAVASLTTRNDRYVADLGGITVGTPVRRSIHDQSSAQSHAEVHVEEIIERLRDAK